PLPPVLPASEVPVPPLPLPPAPPLPDAPAPGSPICSTLASSWLLTVPSLHPYGRRGRTFRARQAGTAGRDSRNEPGAGTVPLASRSGRDGHPHPAPP